MIPAHYYMTLIANIIFSSENTKLKSWTDYIILPSSYMINWADGIMFAQYRMQKSISY
jgi:hypothetical protein